MMNWRDEYNLWIKQPNLDPTIKSQLKSMSEEELEAAFKTRMVFGTAGLRGIIGPGTGRMNIYTIEAATIAFCRYLKEVYDKEELSRGIVIAHDNRHGSAEFSQMAANVISANGIPAYLWPGNELRPTPVLSFAVMRMKTIAGICVTASHNPKEYNGYKIYCKDGYQFLPDATNVIGKYFDSIKNVFDEKIVPNPELIKTVPDYIDSDYIKEVESLQFYAHEDHSGIKLVVSNMHGTSRKFINKILTDTGYDFTWTKEQYDYDPDFKGTKNPNPEYAEAFIYPLKQARKTKADIVILNDPDADRIGIGVLHNGEYRLLTGNETAPIMLEYLLSHYYKYDIMPPKPTLYDTFVTGTLGDKVAISYGCEVIKTLTGFKWIGSTALKEHQKHGNNFIFGYEEAYGYVVKEVARDKDGLQAAMVLAEACWYYKTKHQKTLVDVLNDIQDRFGYYYCHTVAQVYPGAEGAKKIQAILKYLRDHELLSLADIKATKREDYINGLYNMPGQDLQKFYFEDESWFAVRASGTEPKIKFYFVCVGKTSKAAEAKMKKMWAELEQRYIHFALAKSDGDTTEDDD